ncbi:hypothetical protein CQW23_14206 [Capsicum baccatum]|uniref:VAN3-binding protein-like auxin canalisation domain-containing protein n=1 Tax=Capsicum baccatum TaxID=33114 RepID=A0A2G2WIH9_CAPBA|nr:hypothetical protein CQW23_14206 [Capsicum baccatum]
MGVECEHLASMISFAVNVQSAGDIMTLTTAVATGMGSGNGGGNNGTSSGELIPKENFLGICSRKLLARGGELLMRSHKATTGGGGYWFWLGGGIWRYSPAAGGGMNRGRRSGDGGLPGVGYFDGWLHWGYWMEFWR